MTLHSKPLSGRIQDNYFITGDGYVAKNSTIIDKGVLKTFLLGLYASNKTKNDRAVNDGGAFIIESGNSPLVDMVSSI